MKLGRKAVSGIMVVPLFLGMLTLAFSIQPVKTSGTIYIRADGSVDPPGAPISTVDNITYTFTADIYDSIVVERDDITVDGSGYTVEGPAAGWGICLSGRENVTIRNMEIKLFSYGVYLYSSSYNTICGNDITANFNSGVLLESSSNNNLHGNNIADNGGGIYLYASGATIYRNNITNNGGGITAVFYSTLGNISENNITTNSGDGIRLVDTCYASSIYGNNITTNSGDGVHLFASGCGSMHGNNIVDNDWGIWLDEADGQIFENTITNNDHGIYATYWCTARVYHNNFISNTQQFDFLGWGGAVLWDDDYPSGGNYWSDYNGTDMFSGPYQNETGSDGIGDTPYVINEYNQDEYPLMKGIHEIRITAVTTSKTVVGKGYNLNITVTILNYGVCTDPHNITVYANTTTIASQYVVLTSRNSTTITFTWNTTAFAKGNYTISVIAETVPCETDTGDNTYIDGTVLVTIPGDVNGDRTVDIFDAILLSTHFGHTKPWEHPDIDPNVDINSDGSIDIIDAVSIAFYYGQKW